MQLAPPNRSLCAHNMFIGQFWPEPDSYHRQRAKGEASFFSEEDWLSVPPAKRVLVARESKNDAGATGSLHYLHYLHYLPAVVGCSSLLLRHSNPFSTSSFLSSLFVIPRSSLFYFFFIPFLFLPTLSSSFSSWASSPLLSTVLLLLASTVFSRLVVIPLPRPTRIHNAPRSDQHSRHPFQT